MAGTPPTYDGVLWPGAGGIRVPTEVFGSSGAGKAGGSLKLNKSVTHDYGAAHADWTLNPAECQASLINVTNAAGGGANAILPAAFPGHFWILANTSGQTVTFKVTGQTGIAVATAKTAILYCTATDVQRATADTTATV